MSRVLCREIGRIPLAAVVIPKSVSVFDRATWNQTIGRTATAHLRALLVSAGGEATLHVRCRTCNKKSITGKTIAEKQEHISDIDLPQPMGSSETSKDKIERTPTSMCWNPPALR